MSQEEEIDYDLMHQRTLEEVERVVPTFFQTYQNTLSEETDRAWRIRAELSMMDKILELRGSGQISDLAALRKTCRIKK